MMENSLLVFFCHLLGDYVLQCDFIANSKGSNWYHLLVHCGLYIFPFYVAFGMDWRLGVLFVTHVVIDAAKARYKKISYRTDQILHYIIGLLLFVVCR